MTDVVCQQPRATCSKRGTRRVRVGTINGVTDPIVCESHAKTWSDRCYVVEAFDSRSYCTGCKRDIDPDCCHCGDYIKDHRGGDGCHFAVPMGCVCFYAKPSSDESTDSQGDDLPW